MPVERRNHKVLASNPMPVSEPEVIGGKVAFIIGARDLQTTRAAYDRVKYNATMHSVLFLPLDLTDLRAI